MSAIKRVTNTSEAEALAALLNGDTRTKPTVVVTVASGHTDPYADVERIAAEIGDLAELYLVTTGGHTWAFSNKMTPGTQVYGGAGRVYPIGLGWNVDLKQAPLRFAWNKSEGKKLTGQLIDDALDMAAAAGLFDSARTASTRERRAGTVRSIMSERALVDLVGGDMASIPPQLAQAGVPIERVLAPGMHVDGVLEKKSRWLDIRESRPTADEALKTYAAGDVVPAQVRSVLAGSADLRLHPDVTVELFRSDVTGDPDDDLSALLTPGEVVLARVLATGPKWRLSLREVREHDIAREALSLYAGGPPWLDPDAPPPAIVEHVETVPSAPEPDESVTDAEPVPEAPPRPAVPSPAMMPRRRGEPVRAVRPAPAHSPEPMPAKEPAPAKKAAVQSMSLQVTAIKAEKAHLEAELAELRDQVSGLRNERVQFAKDLARAARQVETRDAELARMRSQLRRAKQRTAPPDVALPVFADRERGFRHLVEAAWARRIPVGEQPTRPLPEFAIGDRFLDSVDALEGITVDKIADVVMEVLTGLAEQSTGRELHQLRTSAGGNAAPQSRPDGAVCYRVSMQIHTPSARRLHFWKCPDGTIELSRVVVHDDMEP
ncbi:PE-PGRS family protein [Nocardioidaceae bacterium Broad-1]|nr:PE-PGRS family protein [Nocardioidaceae bacterium Broad-1]